VLDLDIQFGAAGLYLDLHTHVSLSDLIESPGRLDHALLSGVMSHHASGVDVLRAPDDLLPLDAVSTDFVSTLLGLARDSYDYVFIDLPQAWTDWTYATLCQSDLLLLVAQLHVGSIRQAGRQLETIKAHELAHAPLKLALNRRTAGLLSGSSDVRDAEKALKRSFDFLLPNDYELTKSAINRGVLISEIKRRSKLEKKLRVMAADLRQSVATVAGATAAVTAP
jgi:pilus assembly protein CpaE